MCQCLLLSFAQFEREVTGERIRDKIAASKKKGLWMGGLPPLGYDVDDRKLVINGQEAETVRHIYQRYAELGSVRALKDELDQHGIISKRRIDKYGRETGGKPLARGALYLMLQNRIYLGEIVHKDRSYPGEHDPIINEELWNDVQTKLAANRVDRKNGANAREPGLLTGLIFDDGGARMTATHASKKGRRYRYYVSHSLIKRGRPKASDTARRVPAEEIERLVEERLIAFLKDDDAMHHALVGKATRAHEIATLIANASRIAAQWSCRPSVEKRQLLRGLISRITLKPDGLAIGIHTDHLVDILRRGDVNDRVATMDEPDGPVTILTIKARLKRTGMEKKFVVGNSKPGSSARPDASLLKLIARAQELRAIFLRGGRPVAEMATAAGVSSSYFTRMVRLSFLAPDITRAILHGDQPAEISARKLMADTRVPIDWDAQRTRLGFI